MNRIEAIRVVGLNAVVDLADVNAVARNRAGAPNGIEWVAVADVVVDGETRELAAVYRPSKEEQQAIVDADGDCSVIDWTVHHYEIDGVEDARYFGADKPPIMRDSLVDVLWKFVEDSHNCASPVVTFNLVTGVFEIHSYAADYWRNDYTHIVTIDPTEWVGNVFGDEDGRVDPDTALDGCSNEWILQYVIGV